MERIVVDLPKEWLTVADICEYMGVSTFVVTSSLIASQGVGRYQGAGAERHVRVRHPTEAIGDDR